MRSRTENVTKQKPPSIKDEGGFCRLWSIVTLSPDQRHFAHFDKNARLHPNEIHPGADFSSEIISTVPNHQTSARVHEAIRRSPDFPTETRIEASGLCVWFRHNTNLPDLLVRISFGTLSKHSHNLLRVVAVTGCELPPSCPDFLDNGIIGSHSRIPPAKVPTAL